MRTAYLWIAILLLAIPKLGLAELRLAVDDPTLLQGLEQEGFSFGALISSLGDVSNNKTLYRDVAYRSIVDSLTSDLDSLKRVDKRLGPSLKYPHRLFDAQWLKSPFAHFELVGVVNRLDRAPFHPQSCGELRFIYRLAYEHQDKAQTIYSRMPMTVNVVYRTLDSGNGCKSHAQQWRNLDQALTTSGKSGWREAGFQRSMLATLELKSIEVNLQSVRWPSTIRPDMGGYAEYLLRVFQRQGNRYALSELENTPDVARLKADPLLKKKLIDWLKTPANFKAVDDGVARLPDEFLTKKTTSVALHGAHRLANAPFTQVFDEKEFADLPYADARYVRSPHGLLRRLNDLSCVGCHQGRTVAGFHFLGVDRQKTEAVNAIAVGVSSHFVLDQARRLRYFNAVANDKPIVAARPLSLRADEGEGGFGSHCGLGDPSFSGWTCRAGFRCEAVVEDMKVSKTGICQPETPIAGSACRTATMRANSDPHRDAMVTQKDVDCGLSAVCEEPSVGFPGGMCSRGCTGITTEETCGSIAILQSFNECLGKKNPFASCLQNNVRPAALKKCSAAEACRDDFVCARTKDGEGACIPPYFLFQLRVDGHSTKPLP